MRVFTLAVSAVAGGEQYGRLSRQTTARLGMNKGYSSSWQMENKSELQPTCGANKRT